MQKNILLIDFLKKHSIPYHLYEHQPVFTVHEEPVVTTVDGIASSQEIPKPHFKTLFLKDKKGNLFLVSVIDNKRVDLNALNKALGCDRFSFASAEELLAYLKLTPGSVTPFSLLFDMSNKVNFVLDEDALSLSWVSFHPMRNDMTIVTTPQDFLMCIEKMGHQIRTIQIPVK